MSKNIINGNGWAIIKKSPESVIIRLKDPASVSTAAYRSAVSSLCNVKHVQVICTFVN